MLTLHIWFSVFLVAWQFSERKFVVQAHAAAGETSGAMVKIPIVEDHVRSLNLAVSVGVGLYEAIRQLDSQQLTASTAEL